MSMQSKIEQLLASAFNPVEMQVINESHGHNVKPGSETHFKVVIVSDTFEGKNAVGRHRAVYSALAEPLDSGVHALALHTYTPEEWQQAGGAPTSPPCLGGSKA